MNPHFPGKYRLVSPSPTIRERKNGLESPCVQGGQVLLRGRPARRNKVILTEKLSLHRIEFCTQEINGRDLCLSVLCLLSYGAGS